MGVLWYDSLRTRALASFENGIVYKGDGISREQIGTYTADEVYDLHGSAVARFRGNIAYSPLLLSTEGYCTFDSNRIYKGGSTRNDTIAIYDGDPYGACAAAVLYFGLHHNSEQNTSTIPNSPANSINKGATGTEPWAPDGGGIIGAIVGLLIFFVAAYAFYFTEWGHNMVFGEESGRQVFFICMAVSLVSGIIIFRSKSINRFLEIAICVFGSHTVTYLIVLIIAFVDAANQGRLSFGMVIILLIGGVIGTIGVASMFCIIEIPVVYIAKSIYCKVYRDKSNK